MGRLSAVIERPGCYPFSRRRFPVAILGLIFIRAEMLEIAEGSSTSAAAPDAEEDA
jgi:hypothetical protein